MCALGPGCWCHSRMSLLGTAKVGCALWSWPLPVQGTAAGCLLVLLQDAAAGCCVCAVELACRCRSRGPLHHGDHGVGATALWSWLAGAAAGCRCRVRLQGAGCWCHAFWSWLAGVLSLLQGAAAKCCFRLLLEGRVRCGAGLPMRLQGPAAGCRCRVLVLGVAREGFFRVLLSDCRRARRCRVRCRTLLSKGCLHRRNLGAAKVRCAL